MVLHMIGKVVSYRRGRHTQNTGQMLIRVEGDRGKLVGKEVVWSSKSGKQIKGRIAAPHGNKNVVRAIFEKGLPGQAVGTEVEIK
jgi:large subunit ribosomal protein L35Ae